MTIADAQAKQAEYQERRARAAEAYWSKVLKTASYDAAARAFASSQDIEIPVAVGD